MNVKRDISMLWKFDGLRGRFNKDVRTAEHSNAGVSGLIHFYGFFCSDLWEAFIDFVSGF